MTTEGSVTCPDCARRGLLLSALAGHIDRSVDGRVGERAKDLLALGDESLVRAVDPRGESSALERADDPLAYQRLLDLLRSTWPLEHLRSSLRLPIQPARTGRGDAAGAVCSGADPR